MTDIPPKTGEGDSGQKLKEFFGRDFKPERYLNEDGTRVPLHKVVMIESEKMGSEVDPAKLRKILPTY
jgi:hypothetical protein